MTNIVVLNAPTDCSVKTYARSNRQWMLAMDRYSRTVTPDEIEALFMANNPTLTTAQKQAYSHLFHKVKKETPMGSDVAQEVLSKLFQQVVGEDIANLGFDYVNGSKTSLEPLRNLMEQYGDDFTPNLT